jgi:hypothetical protein
MIAQDFLYNFRLRLQHYGRIVVFSEDILRRDFPAGELAICWKILRLSAKHGITGRPSVKFGLPECGFLPVF